MVGRNFLLTRRAISDLWSKILPLSTSTSNATRPSKQALWLSLLFRFGNENKSTFILHFAHLFVSLQRIFKANDYELLTNGTAGTAKRPEQHHFGG